MLRHILLVVAFGCVLAEQDDDTGYDITIRLDNAISTRHDDLVCTGHKLDSEESYIVRFIPHASKKTAHHMMVYGCSLPANPNYTQAWHCPQSEGKDSINAVCAQGERQILFAWALDAPAKSLPDDVGLRVSGKTNISYLVVQLHYAKEFPDGVTDSSGVTLHMTRVRPPQQAGYLILGSMGYIPPQEGAYHMESSCVFDRNYTIYPIGFRTHSHNLGVVTSGYRIRDGIWMEIGRMSPQLPQTFYPVTHPGLDIRPGDKLAGRCTMNSMSRTQVTYIGPENSDEMCNFYIMYSTYEQSTLRTDYCFNNAQRYHWTDDFDPENFPTDASSLVGIPDADQVRSKFHLQPK